MDRSRAHTGGTPSEIDENTTKEEVEQFLKDLQDYEPIIPDEVANYYLSRSGFVCPDLRVQRAVSLAAQKFIADIAETTLQFSQVDKPSKSKGDKKKVLRMEDLSESLKEYGININKPPYFADSLNAGQKSKMTEIKHLEERNLIKDLVLCEGVNFPEQRVGEMSVVLRVKEELQQNELQNTDGIPNVEAAWQLDAEDLEYGDKLGSGAYGDVFSGSYFGTEVAIKLLNVQVMGEDNMAKYIKRELECSKYSHPNIVGFIGIGEKTEENIVCLVTEKLQCSLRDVLKQHKQSDTLSWAQRLSFANDAAKALAFLHAKQIIHRDVKSKNFLIDENMKLKVCDFGFARTYRREKRPMTICGTEEWMAPEVQLEEPYTNSADVYSFGIVLLEIITSEKVKTAFPRGPQNFFSLDVESAKQLIPSDTPEGFADLAFDCCKDDPDERPTFRDILKRLGQIRTSYQLTPSKNLTVPASPSSRPSQSSALAVQESKSSPSSAPKSPRSGSAIAARCSFLELNELGIRVDDELAIEEILVSRFDKTGRGSWIVIGYAEKNVLTTVGDGDGGVEEMVEFLANDEVQYCLLRIPVSKDGIDHHRDVFVYWSGPNVSIIQRGKLKTHLGAVQKVLRPFHADLLAYNKERLTEEIIRDRSDPLSGSHVIE